MNILEVLDSLEKAKSVKDKEKILEAAWNKKIVNLFQGFVIAFDPFYTFGIDKVPYILEEDDEPNTLSFDDFYTTIQKFNTIFKLNKKEKIDDLLNQASVKMWNNWYRRILLKDFKNIITAKQINKVLSNISKKDIQAIKYIIPQIFFQKYVEKQSTFIGEQLVDAFISGTRLAIVLDNINKEHSVFNERGQRQKSLVVKSQEIFDVIPVSVVLDCIKTKNTIYVIDIIPLDEYKKGYTSRIQLDRHIALCSLHELLIDSFGGLVKILPKMKINFNESDSLEIMKTEFTQQNCKSVIVKDPQSPYLSRKNPGWNKITFDK